MANAAIELTVTFLNPALPKDLAELARPVSYVTWSARSKDGKPHEVTLYLDAAGALAVNDASQAVVWGREQVAGLDLLRIGTRDQKVLGRFGDNVRMDWGWFYLGLPQGEAHQEAAGSQSCRAEFAATGQLPAGDDLDQPRAAGQHYPPAPLLCATLPLGEVGPDSVTRHVLLAYDEIYPIEYMQRRLRPYWRTQFNDFGSMLTAAGREYGALAARAEQFDGELEADLKRAGGPEYAAIATLAYGQAMAAHKLVEAEDGTPFFMPKENY